MIGYKLFRLRKDGTLGSLFIDRKTIYVPGTWYRAQPHRTTGFAFRPGFHICHNPHAPHLKMDGREWWQVIFSDHEEHHRPVSQGGLWYTARHMILQRRAFCPQNTSFASRQSPSSRAPGSSSIHWGQLPASVSAS